MLVPDALVYSVSTVEPMVVPWARQETMSARSLVQASGSGIVVLLDEKGPRTRGTGSQAACLTLLLP